MKIKRTLVSVLILCLSLGAFAQAKQAKMTPIQYNDQMADITDSLYKMGQTWGEKFNTIYNGDKNFSALMPLRKKMNAFIDRTIDKVQKQPQVGKGAEGLKSAVLSFLSFENKMVTGAFGRMEQLNSASTDADVQSALKNLTDLAAEEEGILKKVNTAQEAYGSQNGFTIAPPPEEAEK